MFNLETTILVLLILCLVCAAVFEFVNGFHDTANAVATVIYTKALDPNIAVVWSGIFNFIGCWFGGISVAMGIVNLLPIDMLIDLNIYHSIAMILALLLSAIIWNLGTWYVGIPASSSHTLVGSILGVGIAFTLIPGNEQAGVNWGKAGELGMSLLISPLIGFSLSMLLVIIGNKMIKNSDIQHEISSNERPPFWIRIILIGTCTGVSFTHGSNDGQKGVGLVMIILFSIVPAYYMLDISKSPADYYLTAKSIEETINKFPNSNLSEKDAKKLSAIKAEILEVKLIIENAKAVTDIKEEDRPNIRKDIMLISRDVDALLKTRKVSEALGKVGTENLKNDIKKLKELTDYSPSWVLLMIALSLGLGTMIGWKRIVKTIGEKIGKTHLTYIQGASAELVAFTTIGVASGIGLPVSTTHVLSSGIAGTMVGHDGLKNLHFAMIRNIFMAWLLTLPVTIVLSGSLFLIFRSLF